MTRRQASGGQGSGWLARRVGKNDRGRVRSVPSRRRRTAQNADRAAKPHEPGATIATWLDGLPEARGASELIEAIAVWAGAWKRGRTVLFAYDGAMVQAGLAPIVRDLVLRGAISALACSGSACRLDVELAVSGQLPQSGALGAMREASERIDESVRLGLSEGLGMGEAVGRDLLDGGSPCAGRSVLAAAVGQGIPVTVHATAGADFPFFSVPVDAAAIASTSRRDFEVLSDVVGGAAGGAFVSCESTALRQVVESVIEQRGREGERPVGWTTLRIDPVPRLRDEGGEACPAGRSLELSGQPGLLLPLLAAGVIESGPGRSAGRGRGERRRRGPGSVHKPGGRS